MYQNVFLAHDSGTLEQLKELSSKRRAIEESINKSSNVTEAIAREISGGLTSHFEQVCLTKSYYPNLKYYFSPC